MVNKCTWLLLEKIITRYNSRLMSLSKTKATRRSPCYGEERLFLAFLGCWLGRLFRRSLLLVGTLVELGCNHDDSGVLHAILVCPLLWLEETLDGEQRALVSLSNDSVVLVLAPCLHIHESRYAVWFPRRSSPDGLLPMRSVLRWRLRTDGFLHPYLRNLKL